MQMRKIGKMNKVGDHKIEGMIMALIVTLLAGALAPTFFVNWNSTALGANAPTWLSGIATAIIATGLVLVIWRAFYSR